MIKSKNCYNVIRTSDIKLKIDLQKEYQVYVMMWLKWNGESHKWTQQINSKGNQDMTGWKK